VTLVWARGDEDDTERSEAGAPASVPVRRGVVRIDLSSREPVATVPLEQPTWIDSTEDLVWALSPPDKLAKLRPGTNSVIADIRVQPFFNPHTVFAQAQGPDVVASDNAVWVVGRRLKPNYQTGRDDPLLSGRVSLSRIDPTTNTARGTIIKGHGDAAGLALGEGGLWTLDRDAGELLRLDPQTLEVDASIRVEATSRGPSSVAVGEGFVWAANATVGTVTKVDPKTNSVVATIPVDGAQEVATGEGAVWRDDKQGQGGGHRARRLGARGGPHWTAIEGGDVPNGPSVLPRGRRDPRDGGFGLGRQYGQQQTGRDRPGDLRGEIEDPDPRQSPGHHRRGRVAMGEREMSSGEVGRRVAGCCIEP
jgi:hypothetical protein